MLLQFPNARLYIQDLMIRQRLSGALAIVRGAQEYGLIPSEVIQEMAHLDCKSNCLCKAAACKIMDKHFELKSKTMDLPRGTAEQARMAFERETKEYTNHPGGHGKDGSEGTASIGCAKVAPAIFDLLLQQIRRYP